MTRCILKTAWELGTVLGSSTGLIIGKCYTLYSVRAVIPVLQLERLRLRQRSPEVAKDKDRVPIRVSRVPVHFFPEQYRGCFPQMLCQ